MNSPNRTHSRRSLLMGGMAAVGAACVVGMAPRQVVAKSTETAPRTLVWDELIPKGWDPAALFKDRPVGLVREGSSAERALMKEMRDAWDQAPTRSDLAGLRVRMPGYVVPLDTWEGKMKEFLIVPYFGACIHSPPPPANQIVHVTLRQAAQLSSMEVVWVTGVLNTGRRDTGMGISGYTLDGEKVEAYKADRPATPR